MAIKELGNPQKPKLEMQPLLCHPGRRYCCYQETEKETEAASITACDMIESVLILADSRYHVLNHTLATLGSAP